MKVNTCLVVDVWEGQLLIDEAVLKANGVAGMAIRINDINGGHHMDSNFLKQWSDAQNFVRFPYFVYNPWVDGAANFTWLAANMPLDAMSVAVDVEVRKTGYSAATYAGELVKFLALCKLGWKTIIYTAQWFLPYLSSWPKMDYWWAQYPDTTKYFSGVKTWDELKLRLDMLDKPFNVGMVPGTLKLWQFSGDFLLLPGNNRPIDVNIFYGNEQELAAYFGSGTVVVPIQTPGLYSFSNVNYFARPAAGPLTLEMSRQRKLGDNLGLYNWQTLKQALLKLNSTNLAAVDLIARPDWGPSKGLVGGTIKWLSLLWPGRNVVKIDEVVEATPTMPGRWGRVQGVLPGNAAALSPYDNPDVVHMVYNYNKTNGWAERSKPVFIPILDGPWWVEMNKLVSIESEFPKTVKIKAFPRLIVRADARGDAANVGYKYYGQSVIVDQVKIGKGGLWGRLSGGRPDAAATWIALRNNGINWTDWKI